MRTNARRAGVVKIELIEPKPDDAVRLGALHLLHKNQLTPEALSSTIRYCAY